MLFRSPNLARDLDVGVIDALARTARILGEDADALDQWANSVIEDMGTNNLSIIELEKLNDR